MDMDLEEDVEHPRKENSEQIKLLEQKISRLEKLVKSRDEALNEMYDLEKSKNEEIHFLKDRIKQDGIETLKLQDLVKTLNDEIAALNKKITELEQQNINNLKQKQIIDSSSPRIVEDLLTDKESLYKEIANLRLQISQLETEVHDKDDELSALHIKLLNLESANLTEINKLKEENKDTEKLILEKELAQKREYEDRINYFEKNIQHFKSELIETFNIISLIYFKFVCNKEENKDLASESKVAVLEAIPLSKITKELIKVEMNNFQIKEESLFFCEKFFEQIIQSSYIKKECENKNSLKSVELSAINHLFHFFIEQSPLCSVSHTETLYEERKLISNCILSEYEKIEKFLNILLVDSEQEDHLTNIFQLFVDILYENIINFEKYSESEFKYVVNICSSDRQSELYLNTKNIFKLFIKSIIENDSELLMNHLNEILSFISSENSKLQKINFEKEKINFDKKSDFKKILFSIFKLNFGYGWTVLHLLSYLEHIDTLQTLLEQFNFEEQINIINKSCSSGFIPITFSILKDNILLMEFFLSCGADLQTQDNRRNTLLHLTDDQELQEILIKRRISTSVKNSSGLLPNLTKSKSQISKLNFDKNESESILNEHSNSIVNVNTINISELNSIPPSRSYRSLSSQAVETNFSEDKVMLSSWISGNEPNSTCRDDFCVFSTPEFEYRNELKESSFWNILGFKPNNRNISNIYEGRNGDHAAMEQNYDRLEEMGLTSAEKKRGIWSDIVINYTARGLEKSCFPPPLDCPTNIFRQILVLTSERFALFQYSPLKLLQAAPIVDFEEIIIPKNSNVLLLIKIDGWDDILLEINRRTEFLEEFTTAYRTITTPSEILLSHVVTECSNNIEKKTEKSNSFWLGFLSPNQDNKNSNETSENRIDKLSPARATAFQNLISVYGENPPIITEPDNLIGLFNSENQYALVLAIINKSSFMLLPHRENSLLVSMPTYHFGFLGICINPPLALENPLSSQKKSSTDLTASNNELNENRLWQERFFILRSDGILIWCHHPNDTIYCENIPIRLVRQIRVFNLATNTENEVIPCFALDFTKNSVPSSLILHSDSSEMRDKWVEKIHNVRTIISDSSN